MKGSKVDIYCRDSFDIISDNYDDDKTKEEYLTLVKVSLIEKKDLWKESIRNLRNI
jgi:hypothetical protein